MTETSTPMDVLDEVGAGSDEAAQWILPLIFPELHARTLQEKGSQHLLQDNVARLAGNLQAVMSNVAAYNEALQTQWRAIAVLAKGQGQATNDLRELRALVESLVGGVADVAREQAAVRGAMQDSTKIMSTTTETVQQGQRALQTEVEKVTCAIQPTIAALTATAAEQTAVRETVGRVMEQVTGVGAKQAALSEAVSTLAGGQGQLAGDVRRLHELTQTVVGGVADVAREQAVVRGALQESTQIVRTTAEAVQQGQRTLQGEVDKVVDSTKQTLAAVTATAAEQTAVREIAGRVMEQVTGVGARQAALSETVTALAGGQGQLAGEVRRLHELTQMVVGGVADVAREQAAVRGTVQDSTKAMCANAETMQQGQRTLLIELEKIVDTSKQTIAAVTATAAEQTAVHETVKCVKDELTAAADRQTALSDAVQASTDVVRMTAEAVQQGQRTLQTEVEKVVDTTKQTITAVTAMAAEQTAVRETVGRVMEQVTGVGAKQSALSETVTALASGQGQLAGEVRHLHELTQTVVGGVADVAREQAAVRGAMQDSTKTMSATTETIQQGQRALQTEVEKMVDTAKQTIAALTATAAEQTTGQEMTRRMIGEVANAAMAALALGHGRLTGDAPQLPASTQTVGDVGSLEVGPPVPAAESNTPQRLSAAQAITHGEQIRYEVGPDRDNLGCWTNASDWAQWELPIARPGRFKVTAEIAAVASGRFQVVCADQKLEGSAPNTGDYGRFQKVELGTVELTSSGKTSVAVRPIPEGWQPMNLKALDLVPLT